MKTILVTGRIGSGKSEACRHLRDKGWPVYDCDSNCKKLYDSVPGLKQRIEKELGIEFSALVRIFSDPELMRKLEELVFPLLIEDLKQWLRGLDSPLAFVESATALDKPAFDGMFDEVLMITAPLEQRISRNPAAAQRDKLQNCDEKKATHIIRNESTLNELYDKLDKLYENESC